jgi:formamidopyrimidine-DNA glycosylase
MPEGPEIHTIVDRIKNCENVNFERIDVVENVENKLHRFSKYPIKKISNFKIKSIHAHGKMIVFYIQYYLNIL